MKAPAPAALAAALLAPVLTGCGATPGTGAPDDSRPAPASTRTAIEEPPEAGPLPTATAGPPRPGLPRKVDHADPGAVSEAALTVMWTIDTKIDISPHDATLRAIPYVTPEYATEIKDTPQRSGPGAEWNSWAAHHAYTRVHLSPANDAGKPPDTEADAYRTWTVTTTPHGDEGWTGEATTVTAFVELARSGRTWKVNAVQIQ